MTMSENKDWRSPTASEAELIEAWKREDLRDRRPALYALGVMIVLPIAMIVITLTFIGNSWAQKLILILCSFVILDTILLIVFLIVTNRRRLLQVLRGDYQIIDAVVVSKNSPLGSQRSEHYLQVKTFSGEMQNGTVGRVIHKAVTENTPGFLVLVNGEKPNKKGSDMIFIPATPLNE